VSWEWLDHEDDEDGGEVLGVEWMRLPSDDDKGNNNFTKSFVIYAWQTVLKVNSRVVMGRRHSTRWDGWIQGSLSFMAGKWLWHPKDIYGI